MNSSPSARVHGYRRQGIAVVVHGTSGREDPAFRPAMNELRAVEAEAEQAVSA
jgi:hypothetical protein